MERFELLGAVKRARLDLRNINLFLKLAHIQSQLTFLLAHTYNLKQDDLLVLFRIPRAMFVFAELGLRLGWSCSWQFVTVYDWPGLTTGMSCPVCSLVPCTAKNDC